MQTTLVLGGARSGKSAFALQQMRDAAFPRVYLATAQRRPDDPEWEARIERHREDRAKEPLGWSTVEVPNPTSLSLLLEQIRHPILLDCATLWLSALVCDSGVQDAQVPGWIERLAQVVDWRHNEALETTIVSNELGLGLVPEDPLSRRFRDHHGRMNQYLVKAVDQIYFLVAGLPLLLRPHR